MYIGIQHIANWLHLLNLISFKRWSVETVVDRGSVFRDLNCRYFTSFFNICGVRIENIYGCMKNVWMYIYIYIYICIWHVVIAFQGDEICPIITNHILQWSNLRFLLLCSGSVSTIHKTPLVPSPLMTLVSCLCGYVKWVCGEDVITSIFCIETNDGSTQTWPVSSMDTCASPNEPENTKDGGMLSKNWGKNWGSKKIARSTHRISKAKWNNEDMLVWNILAFFMIIFDNVWFNKVFHHPYWLSERLTTSFQNCQRVKPLLWYTHPILSMKKVQVRAVGKVMVQVELSEKRLIWTATKSLRYMSTC